MKLRQALAAIAVALTAFVTADAVAASARYDIHPGKLRRIDADAQVELRLRRGPRVDELAATLRRPGLAG